MGLKGRNTISGKEGEVIVEVGGRRFNYMNLTEIEASVDITKDELTTLKSRMTQHKISAMSGSYSGKGYKVMSEVAKAWEAWKDNKSEVPIFTITIRNTDDSSGAGNQTVTLYDCMSDSFTLAKLDTGASSIDEDFKGTFDDWSLDEMFKTQPGFEV